jgi:hypothetical protein
MGTLGKVFLFINFVVVGAAFYFATQSYSRHQNVTNSGFRHELLLTGVPLEAKGTPSDSEYPMEMDLRNGASIETVRKKVLDEHFQGADGGKFTGGGTPFSQMKEVLRVQGKAKEDLRAANTPQAKLALLAGSYTQAGFQPGWLTNLAETYDERTFVRGLATAQGLAAEQAAATAEQILDKKFAAVTSPPDPAKASAEAARVKEAGDAVKAASDKLQQAATAFEMNQANNQLRQDLANAIQGLIDAQKAFRDVLTDVGSAASRDEGDRRLRIAHLLMLVDPTAGWQKRVALVVGLRTYVKALAAQADRLAAMTISANQQMVIDQAEFVEKFEMLKNLAYQRAVLLQQQQTLNADLRLQLSAEAELVKQRNVQLVRRQQDLAALQAQIAGVLTRHADVEARIFALQQKAGATLQENFTLEEKLEAAERKGR